MSIRLARPTNGAVRRPRVALASEPLERRTLLTTATPLPYLTTTAASTVADLTPGIAIGGVLYAIRAGPARQELWRTDGTIAGTRELDPLADTTPTTAASADFVRYGSGMAFVAGPDVYVSNGRPGGTRVLYTDPAATTYHGPSVTTVGGRLWFTGSTGLYVTDDGTATGVRQVSASAAATLPDAVDAGGFAYFRHTIQAGTAVDLFRTDGTAAGTTLVAAGPIVAVGQAGGRVVYQTQTVTSSSSSGGGTISIGSDGDFDYDGVVDGSDYSLAGGAFNGSTTARPTGQVASPTSAATGNPLQLWAVADDGTPALVRSFDDAGGLSYRYTAPLGNCSYFFAEEDGTTRELWRTDGTPAGTTMVADGFTAVDNPGQLSSDGTRLTFWSAGGTALWTSDGTAAGTVAVHAFASESRPAVVAYGAVGTEYVTTTGGNLYRSDGTPAGTTQVAGPAPAGTTLGRVVADAAGFWFEDLASPTNAYQISATDTLYHAAADGTGTVTAIDTTAVAISAGFYAVAGAATVTYFQPSLPASNGSDLPPLYRTDGTAAGTFALTDPAAPGFALAPAASRVVDNRLIFTVPDTYGLFTLGVTDGTVAGTVDLLDVTDLADAVILGDGGTGTYVVGGEYGQTVVHTGGTVAGTTDVTIHGSGGPLSAVVVGGRVLLAPTAGGTLTASDGTQAGTAALFTAPAGDAGVRDLTAFGSRAFFRTDAGLWATDGTSTVRLGDVPAGTAAAASLTPAAAGDTVFFAAAADQLWQTDGTAAGTREVAVVPGGIDHLTGFAGRAYFTTADAGHGTELWSTDGTTTGLFADVDPGTASSAPDLLTGSGTRLYFVADDGAHGRELWSTDGTAAGTALVVDAAPGPDGGDPRQLSAGADGTVTFAADDGCHGTVLWRTSAGPSAVVAPTPPTAALAAAVAPVNGAASVRFAVTYAGTSSIDPASLSLPGSVTVTASDGTTSPATFVSVVDDGADAARRTVLYDVAAPGGKLTAAANGSYVIAAAADGVGDAAGRLVPAGPVGAFTVAVPTAGATLSTTVAVVGRTTAVGRDRGTVRVTVGDAGAAAAATVAVELLLSTTPTGDPGTTVPITTARVRLRPGRRAAATVRFAYPASAADRTQYVLAIADADGTVPQVDATGSTAVSAPIAYRPASVDLSAMAAAATGKAGRRATAVFRVHNAGSVTAAGPVSFTLLITGGTLTTPLAVSTVTRPLSIRPGATRAVAVPFTIPAGLAGGAYTLTATLSPTTNPADANAADKTVTLPLTVA